MSDGPIPGFTPEQSWALRTIAREAAREAVAELRREGCPYSCTRVDNLEATVYGNGRPGLNTRMVALETRDKDLDRSARRRPQLWQAVAAVVAAVVAFASLIIALVS